jgi:hypothetical protein
MNDPLDARFEALLEPGTPDWLDVQRRARRHLRRVWLIAAVAAVFLAIPTVAIALDPSILPWKSAARAPSSVVHSFAALPQGAPPGMDPHVRPGEARTVPLSDGSTVWIAPAAKGTFCFDFKSGIEGCEQRRVPIDLSLGDDGPVSPGERMPPAIVLGDVNAPPGSTLQLNFSDKTASSLPVIWVGPPISAGFFEQHVPKGSCMTSLVLRDPSGSILASETEMFQGFYTPRC